MKEKLPLVLSLFFIAFVIAFWSFSNSTNNSANDIVDSKDKQANQYSDKSKGSRVKIKTTTAERNIVVHIKGAIKNPGDYEIPYGSTVQDLIVIAGGCLEGADTSTLALNKTLKPNQTIKVPLSNSRLVQDNIVNVNLASLEELDSLPGIGKITAEKIINERNKSKFQDLEDFKQRLNFSNSKIEQLKGLITF
ncbi:DUF655 domain-containing protein [Thermodesulfobium sp.]|jgi:competence protein ComEA|uniref:ComEA family DNA-binding protein n=1 Tax=Thermodesulfobium narugense TaxID=184064 RepID=A0A7C5KEB0_9BACT